MGKTLERPKRRRAEPRGTKAGRKLIAAFKHELDRMRRGEGGGLLTARTVEVPDEPGEYGPADILALRERIEVSQAIFARLVGASRILVSSWEQGKRTPNTMARRLLDEIKDNPERWAAMVRARKHEHAEGGE